MSNADLILHHGKITTMDQIRPEANVVAAEAGKISAIGDDASVLALRGVKTKVIDLGNMLKLSTGKSRKQGTELVSDKIFYFH